MYNLDYLNSRLRGMRGLLLEKRQFDSLITLEGPGEYASFFLGTAYAREVQQASERLPQVERIDEALRRNLFACVQKIYGISEEGARDLLQKVLFWWDLYNLKTVMRGKVANAAPEEIFSALLPVGVFSESALKELIQAPDLKGIADILALWGIPWGRQLRKALQSWQKEEGLAWLEDALERGGIREFATGLGESGTDARIVREFTGYMVDRINLMFVLRNLRTDRRLPEMRKYFIPGGCCLSRQDYAALAGCSGYKEALGILSTQRIFKRLRLSDCRDINHMPSLERWINLQALRRVGEAGRTDPLSIGVLFDYLWRKISEVIDLRLIIRGRNAGIAMGELREMLLIKAG